MSNVSLLATSVAGGIRIILLFAVVGVGDESDLFFLFFLIGDGRLVVI